MGADYRSTACIGVRIPANRLTVKRRTKAFEHSHPENWKVDPVTGKQLWTEETVSLVEAIGVTTDEYDWHRGAAKGAVAVVLMDGSSDRHHHGYVTRVTTAAVDAERMTENEVRDLTEVNIEAEREFLRSLLHPLGLWDAAQFGLWSVPYVSC